jgi:hypothetical protein
MQIVDGDEQRRVGGEVDRQPVEPVQDRERRVVARGRSRRVEDLARGARRGAQLLRLRREQLLLEELAHDPERELLLELAATRDQHARACVRCQTAALGQQPRLADARRSLDGDQARPALGGADDRLAQGRDLVLALEQRGLRCRCTPAYCTDKVPTERSIVGADEGHRHWYEAPGAFLYCVQKKSGR